MALSLQSLVSPSYNGIAIGGCYNILSSFSGHNTLRETARSIALSLGAPIQFVAMAHNISTHTFAAMLYMFEHEYMGSDTEPSVWGQEYTDVLNRERIQRYFNGDVTPTDILCCSFNGLRESNSRDSYLIFNKFVSKFKGRIDAGRFGSFMVFLFDNGCISDTAFVRFLLECESGEIIKGVMDAINVCKIKPHIREVLTRLRGHNDFTQISQAVTSKIATSMTTAQ